MVHRTVPLRALAVLALVAWRCLAGLAFAENPEAAAYANRALEAYKKGDLDDAIKDDTDAIRLDPTLAAAYFNRGRAWKAKGELDMAIKDYTDSIQLDPNDA